MFGGRRDPCETKFACHHFNNLRILRWLFGNVRLPGDDGELIALATYTNEGDLVFEKFVL